MLPQKAMTRVKKSIGFLVGSVALAFCVAYFMNRSSTIAVRELHGQHLKTPRALVPFTLTATSAKNWTNSQLLGKWTVVTFGFTSCPDICPTALAYFRDERKALKDPSRVAFVFVSVDPERDTPAKLTEYVRFFDPNIIGATGGSEELKKVTTMLATSFSVQGKDVIHSPQYFLIDPNGRWVAYYSPPSRQRGVSGRFESTFRYGTEGAVMKSLLLVLLGSSSLAWAVAVKDIEVKDAWVRATPPSMNMTTAYFEVSNNTVNPVALVEVESPVAKDCNIHETLQKGAFTTMNEVSAVEIAPHETTKLAPGGYHVMMTGLKQPLKENETIPLVLKFKDGREVKVEAKIKQP